MRPHYYRSLSALLTLTFLLATGARAQTRTFTLDADFDTGTLVNVNHTAVNNQLRLNATSGTFPFIWVALSMRCTIAKIDTRTGAILGEYRTISDTEACRESSRTTVSIDGSVWVGHRGTGGVTHVGLQELNQCIDRNGNSTIETSTAYGDVKPWSGAASNVANAQDECILHHVNTHLAPLNMGDSRHMSIDANNKLWVGDFNGGGKFVRINGTTGAVETAVFDWGCGGYGGLIDRNGVIWSGQGSLLRWDPNAPTVNANSSAPGSNPRCIAGTSVYGLAVDPAGNIWANTFGNQVRKISPDGNTISGPFNNGSSTGSQGLAVDASGDVWVSSSLNCSAGCTIGHLRNNGTFVGNVPNPTGAGSTGVAVDADGKIWSVNRSSHTATRINPALNGGIGGVDLTVNFPATAGRPLPFPYNYSDMTGAQLFSNTAPQGSWTVVHTGNVGQVWPSISWNANTPSGSSVTVEARAAATQVGLGSQPFVAVTNGGPLGLTGQFIQVRATLRAALDGTSPALLDLTIAAEVITNACMDPLTEPSFDGNVIRDGARRLVAFNAPQGTATVEFYSTSANLVVGAPETAGGAPIAHTRVGNTFTFTGTAPTAVRFPISSSDAGTTSVSFFVRVVDTCQRTVNLDPQLEVTAAEGDETAETALLAPSPNPFGGSTRLGVVVAETGIVRVTVFDALGREVARLVDGPLGPGRHAVTFDGSGLPAGVYVVRMRAGAFHASRTVTLIQ